jgi:hypothetical protein
VKKKGRKGSSKVRTAGLRENILRRKSAQE